MNDKTEPKPPRKGARRLLGRTLSKAWDGNIFSESAEAAFWQTLSLPPLLLGLLGCLGYMGDWFGQGFVANVHDKIITFTDRIFTGNVVHQIIEPTVDDILTIGKGEIVSVGFIISLWAGSSAMSSFVDAITVAHDQYGVRNEVWQRIFALLLYLACLVLLVIGLPVIAIGPDLLTDLFPDAWRPALATWVGALYYPVLGVVLVLGVTTLYKVALPRRLPWHRGLPGGVLAMVIFLLSSVGLRIYLTWITHTGYTYGALATPIAWLLFTYFIGMAVVGGAYFNSAIQELWPAKRTRRQRRKWRRLEMERAGEKLRHEGKNLWERTAAPLRRPHKDDHAAEPAEGDAAQPAQHGADGAAARPAEGDAEGPMQSARRAGDRAAQSARREADGVARPDQAENGAASRPAEDEGGDAKPPGRRHVDAAPGPGQHEADGAKPPLPGQRETDGAKPPLPGQRETDGAEPPGRGETGAGSRRAEDEEGDEASLADQSPSGPGRRPS